MKLKNTKIICGVLIVAIVLIFYVTLTNNPNVVEGHACLEVSPLDNPLYACHTEGEGSICVSELETCACVGGACVCD